MWIYTKKNAYSLVMLFGVVFFSKKMCFWHRVMSKVSLSHINYFDKVRTMFVYLHAKVGDYTYSSLVTLFELVSGQKQVFLGPRNAESEFIPN